MRRTLTEFGLPISVRISATAFSKKRDCIPVAPTEPISSLSTSKQQVVRFTLSTSSIATKDVYAHTRSSWPYAITIERSKPISRALPAGTISSSADNKSRSTKPYSFSRRLLINLETPSFSSSFTGRLPMSKSRASPSITLAAFFCICSCPK